MQITANRRVKERICGLTLRTVKSTASNDNNYIDMVSKRAKGSNVLAFIPLPSSIMLVSSS